MSLDDKIRSRINAARSLDKYLTISDFQLKAAANGYVLINLKTRRAELIYDDDSERKELTDLEELFPDLVPRPPAA